MLTIKSTKQATKAIKEISSKNKSIGFVPTMGALHEGHLSLIKKARRECDIVVLSIFVNPTQFAANEDLNKYPRQKKKDELLAKKEKVDIIFYPSVEEMYKNDCLTFVETTGLGKLLCGKYRPRHFRGITTVVAKLLNIVTPNVIYLGSKDGQQAIIIRKMVDDLNFNVKVRICPTIRERDGLAMSSRNSYLTKKQRSESAVLFKALKLAKKEILSGQYNSKKIINFIRNFIITKSSAKIDYIGCVNRDSLKSLEKLHGRVMIALAVKFKKVRLIDNIVFKVK
ncbi:MAG: pantoate--beta-alanine ligase [Candidatus Zapsychrus exili]|nr:pantoate--beta-alanine ligase [Candidatus Zapsychrus exili]